MRGWQAVVIVARTTALTAAPFCICRGKPLVPEDASKTGRKWRHPSPTTALKSAALRTLCQALVPDSSRAQPTRVRAGRERGAAAQATRVVTWQAHRIVLPLGYAGSLPPAPLLSRP